MKYITPINLIITCIALATAVFIYTNYLCIGDFCYDVKFQLEAPFYFFSGLVASLTVFFFTSREIFLRWLKKIVSWYAIILILVASNENPYPGGILTFDRGDVVILMMALLFLITLIYVPIVHRIQRKKVESGM